MSILDSATSLVTDPLGALVNGLFGGKKRYVPQGPDFPGGFVITEYINRVPQPSTALILQGNFMPFQPFGWGGEQRLIKEYYPGNPEPAVQVLGPKEGPVKINGRFKDKRLKDTSLYGVSYQFALAADAIRKRGNLVKFGMQGAAGNWIRYGYLESVSFKMNKLSWIDYEIDFIVMGETLPTNDYFVDTQKDAPDAINQSLINRVLVFQASYSTVPSSMPQSLAGLINGLTSDVASKLAAVTGFVSTVLQEGQDLANAASRAVGLIKVARTALYNFRRQITGIQYTYKNLSSTVGGATASSFGAAWGNAQFVSSAASATLLLSQILAQMQAQFAAIARTVPQGRHKVQAGETLQKISIKYYGTMDHWNLIYDHNQLQSTALVAGKVLEIPKV